jgi:hypothetical protein
MVLEVAIEGGYLNRESDGPPGAQVLWRGHYKLRSAVAFLDAIHVTYFSPPPPPLKKTQLVVLLVKEIEILQMY